MVPTMPSVEPTSDGSHRYSSCSRTEAFLVQEGQTIAAAMQGMLLTRDMSNYGVDRGFLTWACSSQHR